MFSTTHLLYLTSSSSVCAKLLIANSLATLSFSSHSELIFLDLYQVLDWRLVKLFVEGHLKLRTSCLGIHNILVVFFLRHTGNVCIVFIFKLLELLADNWHGAAAQIPVLPVSAGGTGQRTITVYSTVYINGINYLTNTIYRAYVQYVGRFLGLKRAP